MKKNKDGFSLSTEKAHLQIDRIHRFLSEEAYWSLGIPRTVVERAIEKSDCYGVFSPEGAQVGFARVVTDSATFAWICDVYIESAYRGQGLSKWLIANVMQDLKPLRLRRICLTTKDAHGLYQQFGIQMTETPDYWMERKDSDVYRRSDSNA